MFEHEKAVHFSAVTVDERLVPFKGRCTFCQYMPGKPAKYGLKLWEACDARSSYAWKMRVYLGKRDKAAPPERDLAARVVLDVTEGLRAGTTVTTVTTDNFLTSYALAVRLMRQRCVALLGTMRAGRVEVPRALTDARGWEPLSTSFAFAAEPVPAALVSYASKRGGGRLCRCVALLSIVPRFLRPAMSDERSDLKPLALLEYNATKGGVDNLDKVLAAYSCRRKTARWPLALFDNMLDVSAYNAYVLWRETRPDWMRGKRAKRRIFLERLGLALARELSSSSAPAAAQAPREGGGGDRKRCGVCPRSRDAKTHVRCRDCGVPVCGQCALPFCPECAGGTHGAERTIAAASFKADRSRLSRRAPR